MEWLVSAGMFAGGYLLALWRHGNAVNKIERAVQSERNRARHIYNAAAISFGVDVTSVEWLQALRVEEARFDGHG